MAKSPLHKSSRAAGKGSLPVGKTMPSIETIQCIKELTARKSFSERKIKALELSIKTRSDQVANYQNQININTGLSGIYF